MPRLVTATLRHLDVPLIRPNRLAYRTFEAFEPYLVEVADDGGRTGFADGHISPGSSGETREGGWAYLRRHVPAMLGQDPERAKTIALSGFEDSKVASTALACAIEALDDHPFLRGDVEVRLPLLAQVNASDTAGIEREVEMLIAEGYRTFKIKVGRNADADLERVRTIQRAAAARATLRLDANRAFTREDGMRFASLLDPDGIELFEQPCDADDWDANAAVASVSAVPLMLDEPICTLSDIERAGQIPNVRFCKLKLKRFGGLDRLREGLQRVLDCGMRAVLGDGLGSEVHNWLEACAARELIYGAGEFNGFLKARDRLLLPPMPFEAGSLRLPRFYRPVLDRTAIDRLTRAKIEFVFEGGRVMEIADGA